MSERIEDDLLSIKGLFVGQLDAEGMQLFETALDYGLAFYDYNHSAGLLGLAKVGVYNKDTPQ